MSMTIDNNSHWLCVVTASPRTYTSFISLVCLKAFPIASIDSIEAPGPVTDIAFLGLSVIASSFGPSHYRVKLDGSFQSLQAISSSGVKGVEVSARSGVVVMYGVEGLLIFNEDLIPEFSLSLD